MIGAKNAVAKYCAELKIAEASPRSPAGNHADVMRPLPRERRSLGRADRETQDEQQGDGGATGHETDGSLEHREQRPQRQAEGIGGFRPEPIEEPAAWQLRQHVGPGEREDVAHLDRRQAERRANVGACDGNRRPIGIVDGRDDEQGRQHDPAHVGGRSSSACVGGRCLH